MKRNAPYPSVPTFDELANPLPCDLPKYAGTYSISRAIASAARRPGNKPDGLEGETSDEIAKRAGKTAKGFYIPHSVSYRALNLSSGVGAIPTIIPDGTFVDALRNKMVCGLLGAKLVSLGGTSSPIQIPAKSQATAVSWVADGSPPAAQANLISAPISLSPKTAACWTDLTRTAWKSGTPDLDKLILDDFALSIGSEIDRAALAGTGSSNQPKGLLYNASINTYSLGTNGAAFTRTHALDLEYNISNANADAASDASLGWVSTPGARKKLRTVDTSGNSGRYLWSDDGYILEYPAFATNSLPGNLTKGSGTNLHALIYGNFADLIINLFSAVDLMVDPFKFSTNGALRLLAFQDVDVAVAHTESFQLVKDMLIS